MKWLFVLFVAVAVPAWADEAHLVTPPLAKPATEAAEGDALHEKYEAAWFRYEKAIGEVRDKVNAALDAQFEKAADAGNLDLADMWDKKKKLFLDTGAVAWPSDGKTKVQWRKTYPTTDFPDDFTDVIAAAGAGFEKAVASLKEDYESLVKDYTKGRNLARAKGLRAELAGLARKPVVPAEPPAMVEKKPSRVSERVSGDAVFVPGSEWISDDGVLRLRLLTREGENFTGLFHLGQNQLREVKGSVQGGKLQWLAKDVTAHNGGRGGDNFGTLSQDDKGPKLDFTWVQNGNGGAFTLRMVGPKP